MPRLVAAACVLGSLLIATTASAGQDEGARTAGAPLKGVDVKLGKRVDARCAPAEPGKDPQPCPTPSPSATPTPKPSGSATD